MMKNEIDIYMDYVIAFGVRVNRPNRVSRSDWLDFWEGSKPCKKTHRNAHYIQSDEQRAHVRSR